MYLLSQLWLYLLLACLAGLGLGLLLNRFCQQRRHAAQMEAMQAQHRDERVRADAALSAVRNEHAMALETAAGERAALETRLAALDAEHRVTGERALALSASVDEHHTARQGLSAEVESLQGRYGALQAELERERQACAEARAALQARFDALDQEHQTLKSTYESRLGLLNAETSRASQMSDELAELISADGGLAIAPMQAMSSVRRAALLRRWLASHHAAMPSRAWSCMRASGSQPPRCSSSTRPPLRVISSAGRTVRAAK